MRRRCGLFVKLLLTTSYPYLSRRILTSGQSNLTKDRIAAADEQFSRIRQVAPVCPATWAHWRIRLNFASFGPPESTTAIRSVQPFLHSARQKVPTLYNQCFIERGSIQCTNQNRNLHISEIRLLFPVLFTIEWKVGIAEFYLYMGFGADLLKKTAEIGIRTPLKLASYIRFV